MKNDQTVERRASSVESLDGRFVCPRLFDTANRSEDGLSLNPQPSTLNPLRAFTLIELLTVIAIIGVIASLVLAVSGPVKKMQYVHNARAEMAQLETAIERYKAAYGVYPPSPTNAPAVNTPSSLYNQLFYELEGTTGDGNMYTNLDGSDIIKAIDVPQAFLGVGGFINCTKVGLEDSPKARNFLPDLKPNQIARWCTNYNNSFGVTLIVSSVRGPDVNYMPLGVQDLNPWRYNSSSPTNNPGSYDLWIQLAFGGKTNLICNWSDKMQINNLSLP